MSGSVATLRVRNGAVLAVPETVVGTFQAPAASTDGFLVENPQVTFELDTVETNELTGSLDGRGPIVGGMRARIAFSLYLKGQGAAGQLPEFHDLLEACGLDGTANVATQTATTFSINGGTGVLSDSANGLAVNTVGTAIFISGFANAANNGAFRVGVSAAGSLTLTREDGSAPNLVTEAAGPSVTISRFVAGTAATAGAATSVVAQAPFAATAQLYRGMPVLVGGNPAAPVYTFLSDYTAARLGTLVESFSPALSASSILSIPAHVLYVPVSSGIPALSMEVYRDGVRYRFTAVRGTVEFQFQAAGAVRANFSMSGLFVSKADAAIPTGIVYDGTRPTIFRNSRMLVNRARAALQTFSIGLNNEIQFPVDPNEAEGFGPPQITSRRVGGSMDPFETLVATRDIMSAFRAGAEQIVHARAVGGPGQFAGNRIGLTVPQAFYTTYAPGDRNGLATEQVGFFARGQDSGFALAIY
jgi:hypothetical protein